MAIQSIDLTEEENIVAKKFVDRKPLLTNFRYHYAENLDDKIIVMTFCGPGGIGKSALLEQFEDDIKNSNSSMREKYYVKYDFSINTDRREVLKTLKFQLSAYGCEFPLFDMGDYYYSLKTGHDITPPKAKSMLEKLPWVQKIKTNLSKAVGVAGDAKFVAHTLNDGLNALTDEDENLAEFFFRESAEFLGESILGIGKVTKLMSIADKLLTKYYMNRNGSLDAVHSKIRFRLNALRQEKLPTALYEYLPTLFAQDVKDWRQEISSETTDKIVIFLDNYESLTGATKLQPAEQRGDLWLSGNRGLIFGIPNTLWIIAGRNFNWSGPLADGAEQYLIETLTPDYANEFLKEAGIADENLRADLVKLTDGYPIFLALCVDAYAEYKNQHNDEPTIEAFGQKREEVVERILRYMDDAAKDMIEFLCVLSVWTDELAEDIGGAALHNFSRNIYERVKKYSLIQSERVTNEDVDLTVFHFHKTIQMIHLVKIINDREKLINNVKTAVDEYFKNFFANKETLDAKKIFYLKLWAEFIVRFGNDADTLREQYEDKLDDHVNNLIEHANFDAAEEILRLFMNKIESLGETNA